MGVEVRAQAIKGGKNHKKRTERQGRRKGRKQRTHGGEREGDKSKRNLSILFFH